ncbi:MAG: site-2 protease family protein, partial [Stackebrandtia sp.]
MSQDPSPVGRSGLRVGRVLGVPVIISPTWLILAVLVTVIYSDVVRGVRPDWSDGLVYLVSFGFVVTLCGSVFLHELGHAFVSRRCGIGVRSITLEMLGGHTEMAAEADRPRTEAFIALAGPAVSALLGLIGLAGLAFTAPDTLAGQFAFQIAVCNIIVAIYNSLPGMPLDGGRALRAMVWAIKGDRHLASRVAGWFGRGIALLTAGVGASLYANDMLSALGVVFTLVIATVLWMGATR